MTEATVTGLLLFGGVVLLGIVGLWVVDVFIAWLCRDVLRFRFGFPAEYQISPMILPSEARWLSLWTSKVGGIVTNTLFAAPLDEGLAFEVRSVFRSGLMRPAIVPWSALRLAESPGRFGVPIQRLEVVDNQGIVVTTIEPGRIEPDWIPRMYGVAPDRG